MEFNTFHSVNLYTLVNPINLYITYIRFISTAQGGGGSYSQYPAKGQGIPSHVTTHFGSRKKRPLAVAFVSWDVLGFLYIQQPFLRLS